MRVMLRVKYRFLGITLGTSRIAYGISHDEHGRWTTGRINDPTDDEIKRATKLYDRHGVTLASTGYQG